MASTPLLARRRVTDVSRIRGTRRTQKDTRGHDSERNWVREDTVGTGGTREDTMYVGFGTVRPRVQNPGPPTIFEFKIGDSAWLAGTRGHSGGHRFRPNTSTKTSWQCSSCKRTTPLGPVAVLHVLNGLAILWVAVTVPTVRARSSCPKLICRSVGVVSHWQAWKQR